MQMRKKHQLPEWPVMFNCLNSTLENFKCNQCDFALNSTAGVRRHHRQKHIGQSFRTVKFQCRKCSFCSHSKLLFEVHQCALNWHPPSKDVCSYNYEISHFKSGDGFSPTPVEINSISYLQGHRFNLLSHEDRIKIKKLGRPMPEIKLEVVGSSRSKTYKRQFNRSVYTGTKWICGCDKKNALFCFPCVLFGGDKSWTVSGVRDLGHLSEKIKRHEATKKHLSNEVSLALLGNLNLQTQLDSAYWTNVQRHNEQVNKNRHVLSRIIDCIKFCGAFELTLGGNDENDVSNNSGVFRGLINFSAEFDNALREDLNSASVFKGTSKDMQNELLQYMLDVCRESITAEINDANYLAVMADETSDVASKFQMVVVLRYIKEGNPVERFLGFVNPTEHNAGSLARCIQFVIDPLLSKNPNKLIAQAYDGAAVMSGKNKSVQTIIKQKYPLANFIHCYAHQLYLIMSQAVSHNTQVRVFFSNVDDVVNFFSNSVQNIDIFNEIVRRRLPQAIQTRWNLKSRAINVIYEHRISLMECMQEIQEKILNTKVINQASAIERLLADVVFLFWLNIFHHIMPYVDILSDQLQRRTSDVIGIKKATNTFEYCISNIGQNIDEIIQKVDLPGNGLEPTPKRIRISKDNLRASALDVCGVIIQTIKDRFEYVAHLEAECLFSSELFPSFSKKFPDSVLNTAVTTYPGVFDFERLKTELSIIYTRPDFRHLKGAVSFLKMLKANNLQGPFRETIKLLELLITIPMPTSETERCFSTLKKVKAYLGNSMDEDRLSALAMLSIENALVKKDKDFNNKVIEKFSNSNQKRLELIYRK